jgi:hypothetical protein
VIKWHVLTNVIIPMVNAVMMVYVNAKSDLWEKTVESNSVLILVLTTESA